jgi:hypothetical protein
MDSFAEYLYFVGLYFNFSMDLVVDLLLFVSLDLAIDNYSSSKEHLLFTIFANCQYCQYFAAYEIIPAIVVEIQSEHLFFFFLLKVLHYH